MVPGSIPDSFKAGVTLSRPPDDSVLPNSESSVAVAGYGTPDVAPLSLALLKRERISMEKAVTFPSESTKSEILEPGTVPTAVVTLFQYCILTPEPPPLGFVGLPKSIRNASPVRLRVQAIARMTAKTRRRRDLWRRQGGFIGDVNGIRLLGDDFPRVDC